MWFLFVLVLLFEHGQELAHNRCFKRFNYLILTWHFLCDRSALNTLQLTEHYEIGAIVIFTEQATEVQGGL